MERLGILIADFAVLSLLSVGGAVSVLPEMHRSLVDVHGWMSGREFSDLFARSGTVSSTEPSDCQ